MKGIVNIQFRIGSISSSINSINVAILIGIVKFYVVKVNTPFLFYLVDINNL